MENLEFGIAITELESEILRRVDMFLGILLIGFVILIIALVSRNRKRYFVRPDPEDDPPTSRPEDDSQ